MTQKQVAVKIENARKKVRALEFVTDAWENAMQVVRDLCAMHDSMNEPEEFCSIDSGFHRSRLTSGRIV